ncbi:Hypothetical_protein [Hexamita inflata]|nr:Hypothetical protein HINF_LOCUS31860 [Hexamita inflata]
MSRKSDISPTINENSGLIHKLAVQSQQTSTLQTKLDLTQRQVKQLQELIVQLKGQNTKIENEGVKRTEQMKTILQSYKELVKIQEDEIHEFKKGFSEFI